MADAGHSPFASDDFTDLKATIQRAEQLAAALFGVSATDLSEQSLFDWWPQLEHAPFGDACRQAVAERSEQMLDDVELGDPPMIAEVHVYPSVSGLTLILKDVTRHRHNERAT